ncbi:MAG: carboxypeptidase regulatory-like domain-containing protein [Candidatus Competibacteraceae bacterium]|nr:carboxypeptidase regulatory-like domain-containing protein [Candidatus Competibacteraceae bacterium]
MDAYTGDFVSGDRCARAVPCADWRRQYTAHPGGGEPYSTDASAWFTAEPEETIALPDLAVSRFSASMSGIVMDDNGAPVGGATLRIEARGYETLNLLPRTDQDGRFQIDHLPDYPVQLCVEGEGFRLHCQSLNPGTAYEITLKPDDDATTAQ